MEIKKLIFYLFLFCIASNILFSQDVNTNYFIDTEDGEPRFKQRLSWRGDENTYRYEVIIEKNENGSFISHVKETTSSRYIIVSLPHGDYRFRVIPYDIFEIEGKASEWRSIEVRQALQPRISESVSEIMLGEDGLPFGVTFLIAGSSIDPDAEYFLYNPDNTLTVLDIIEYDEEGNAKVFVDTSDMSEGEYDIIVRNPGGLEASVGNVVVNNVFEQIAEIKERIINREEVVFEEIAESEETQTDISGDEKKAQRIFYYKMGLAWSPLFSLYGYDNFSLISFSAYFDFIFRLPLDMYLGPEVMFCYNDLNGINICCNILVEKWTLNKRIIIGFRAGTGTVIFSQIEFMSIFLNLGASISWRFVDNFLLDTGVNYVHLFGEYESGYLNPFIGLKLQL